MTPVTCQVKHAPDEGTYGDCLRACIATVLDLGAPDVPHFFHDDCDGDTGMRRVREWLGERGYAPFYSTYDRTLERSDILTFMAAQNPDCTYLLYGATAQGDHVVVCQGGAVVHNPSWDCAPIIGPCSNGWWVVMVIAVK